VAPTPYDEPATGPLRLTVPGAQAGADVTQAYAKWHEDLFGLLVIVGDIHSRILVSPPE
jgi:hypothetical protein